MFFYRISGKFNSKSLVFNHKSHKYTIYKRFASFITTSDFMVQGRGRTTNYSQVKEETQGGKQLKSSIGRLIGSRGWIRARPLLAALIVGAGVFMAGEGFRCLEVPEARAEQVMRPAQVMQIQTRRAAFEAAAAAVTTYFEQNFGPGTDGEGLPATLAVDPGTRPNQRILSNLIDSTAALYASLGHPIEGLPARNRRGTNMDGRLAVFNRWLSGRLGTTRQDTDPITPEDLAALRRVAIFDVDDVTTVRGAVAQLRGLADGRAASLTPTEDTTGSTTLAAVPVPQDTTLETPETPAAPPTVAAPLPETLVEETAGPIEEAASAHRTRMVARLSETIGLARRTLTTITEARSGTNPFPAELATQLQAELSRRIQNISPYLTDAERQRTLQPEFVEDQREGLSELSESILIIVASWRYAQAHLPADADARAMVNWRFENAVNILTNPDYNPFRPAGGTEGYRAELRGLLGGQYEERVRARSGGDVAALVTALNRLDADGVPEAIRTDAREVARRLRRPTPALRRRAGELLVEHDLLRSWAFRYDAAEYQAFRAIWELPAQLDAAGERALAAIGTCHAAYERTRLYYSDLHGRITAELNNDSALPGLSAERRLELTRLRLTGPRDALQEAIAAFTESGLGASTVVTRGGVRVEIGTLLAEAREMEQAATTMLGTLTGSLEHTRAAITLAQRVYAAALDLSAVGYLTNLYNERARFASVDDSYAQYTFDQLRRSVGFFGTTFVDPTHETYYLTYGAALALNGAEALASPAMHAFARAGVYNSSFEVNPRVAFAQAIDGIESDLAVFAGELSDADVEEMQAELERNREGLAEFNSTYADHVRIQREREASFFRLMASLRGSTDFGAFRVPLLSTTDTGAHDTDVYLDYRQTRMPIQPMARLRNPFEEHADDAIASDMSRHRRIEADVVDRAGRLFGEVERQRRMRADTNAPEVLRAPLERVEGFTQLDIPAIEMELAAVAQMYESGASYSDITARADALHVRILDARIAQLDLLIRRTAEPTNEAQLVYYREAQTALDEARAMRASTVPGPLRAGFRDQSIIMAEHGLVQLSQIPGYGTYQPPALSQFFVELRSRPRREGDNLMIVVEHTLVRTPDHPDGIDIQQLQDAGGSVGRLWYGYLVSEHVPGVGHLIRNPRYNPESPDPAQPRWLGWIDTRASVVRPMRPMPDRITPDSTVNVRDYIQFGEVLFRLDSGRDHVGQPLPDMSDEATARLMTDLQHTPAVEEPGSRYRAGERRGDVMTAQEFGIHHWGAGTRVGVYVRRLFRRARPAPTVETEE